MKDITLFLVGIALMFLGAVISPINWIATVVMLAIGFSMVVIGWNMHNTIHIIGKFSNESL